MHNGKSLMITPVKNGFIVELPTPNSFIPGIPGIDIDTFAQGIKTMTKDIHDDDEDIISKMRKQAESDLPKPMSIEDNVYIFTHFQEALNFLSDYYPHA